MDRCFWCHKLGELYAFNLCAKCYKWFYRHKFKQPYYCTICDNYITSKDKTLCNACKDAIREATHIPKRIQILHSKYEPFKVLLDGYQDAEIARGHLIGYFTSRQHKLLDIILDRYYNQSTLEEIGKKRGTSREYIRQCEDKALEVLNSSI